MIAFKQKGPVNYTVVGSPTIVGGVASGFDNRNFLKITDIPSDVTSQQIFITCTTGELVSDNNYFLLSTNYFLLYIRGDGKLELMVRGESGNVWNHGNTVFSSNTQYLLKIEQTGNTITVYLLVNGVWTAEINTSASANNPFYIRMGYYDSNYLGWNGSIDLNETYIKLNGLPWFGVCTTPVSRVRLQGPVEYTVVGSPTIQNGIVSGFSTSNYLKSGGVFDISHPFEVNISVKDFEGTGGSQYVFGLSAGSEGTLTHSLGMYHGGQATGLSMSYGSNQYWSSLAPTLTAHVPYTINLSSDGTIVMVKVTQGNNSKTSTKALSDFATTGTCELRLGLWATYGQVFTSGSIDLNETYVRVNGKLWFGKEPVQKIVKDGVTVWEEV